MRIAGLDPSLRRSVLRTAALVTFATMTGFATNALADSVYVNQMPAGTVTEVPLHEVVTQRQNNPVVSPHRQGLFVPPEGVATASARNVAQTLEIGRRNSVYQLQSGTGNTSTAGVIGSYNNLAVLQGGNNLRSNVMLLNTTGLNVGVLQPAGSAPVNLLVARLPGGGLLIAR